MPVVSSETFSYTSCLLEMNLAASALSHRCTGESGGYRDVRVCVYVVCILPCGVVMMSVVW